MNFLYSNYGNIGNYVLIVATRETERDNDKDDDSEDFEDMKFNGGLCIPGKIWHRLYKYVTSSMC